VRRLILLLLLVALAWVSQRTVLPLYGAGFGQVSVGLGFLLLAAFLTGELIAPLGLPHITGYLLAGLFFGPGMLGLVSTETLANLKIIDGLALTFIALSAGGELEIGELRRNRRVIGWALVSLIVVVFVGSTLLFLLARPLFAFTREIHGRELIVMAMVLGAIATARSPASAIAIIKETRAGGPFTEVALGLTVAMDILAIVLFALVISAGEALLSGGALNAGYLGALLVEIGLSLGLGVGLGLALAAWLRRSRSHHLITIFVLALAVTELSYFLNRWLEHRYHLDFHLEPMLICIATGFVVRNFSEQGLRFLGIIERGGLMVYTLFFALAGAALDLTILRHTWLVALLLVLIRFISIQLGAWLGATIARAEPVYRRYLGITFVTQAGVSLGLAKAVEARFPGWGASVATLAIASISINQLVGPIFFKHALSKAGEVGAQDAAAPEATADGPSTHPAAGNLGSR